MGRSSIRRLLAGGALVGAALVPAAAGAVGTLDQQQTSTRFSINLGSSLNTAQTFTAGLTGSLDQVDLLLSSNGGSAQDLVIEIRNVTEGGAPGTDVLASESLPMENTMLGLNWYSVQFTAPVEVVAGTQYAIVIPRHLSDLVLNWAFSDANPYSGGGMFTQGLSASEFGSRPDDDTAFKTYVTLPAPPECHGLKPTLTGTSGNDVLAGTGGVDVIAGLDGDDTIAGMSGSDTICGGDGKDTLSGASGNDTLDGGEGADKLVGGSDNDHLIGGSGSPDTCSGDAGKDTAGTGCEIKIKIP